MRSDTTRKGELAKCKVMFRAYEKGVVVSIPTVDVDYDLVLDINGRLFRCQVKYANAIARRGAIELGMRRSTRRDETLLYDSKGIDAVLVYVAREDKVLWLPPDKWIGKVMVSIRFDKPKNNQSQKVLMANDFVW